MLLRHHINFYQIRKLAIPTWKLFAVFISFIIYRTLEIHF
jgi:hypothetical protein